MRGCDGPTQMSSQPRLGEWPLNLYDERGASYEYYVCPSRLIPATVDQWDEKRRYLEDDAPHTRVPFEQVPERERAFNAYYRMIKNKLREWSTKGGPTGKE